MLPFAEDLAVLVDDFDAVGEEAAGADEFFVEHRECQITFPLFNGPGIYFFFIVPVDDVQLELGPLLGHAAWDLPIDDQHFAKGRVLTAGIGGTDACAGKIGGIDFLSADIDIIAAAGR